MVQVVGRCEVSAVPDFRDASEQFRAAIGAAGLTMPAAIEADGRLHRFSSNVKRSDLSGWYVFHAHGIPSGAFGCWRLGLTQTWSADIGRRLTDEERRQLRDRAEAAKQLRAQAEAERHATARTRAATEWAAASPATAEHRYLKSKRVAAHGLRADDNGRLLVPLRDRSGELHSLQFIGADGDKRFLPGGSITGNYYAIGTASQTLCIAEGFATAATVHEATGLPVAVAFNAGNLEAVARALREKLPNARIILCADDDVSTPGNPGVTKATTAAQAVGGWVAVPYFGPERPDKATDFNDLAQSAGLEAVRSCIAKATEPGLVTWCEPLPLVSDRAEHPYPVDALPGALRDAVKEVTTFVQCPVSMAACSALTTLSVAAQGLADVRRDEGLEGPISLFVMVVADSGERKSSVDGPFKKGLSDWQSEQMEILKPDLARSRAELSAWMQECEGVRLRIKQDRAKGKTTDAARAELLDLELRKPEPVRVPRVLLESETAENLSWSLRAEGWPTAGLLSNEAGVVFGGHAMRRDSRMQNMALLNKLWSGEPYRVGRRSSECYEVNGARLTMGLAVQPETVETFFNESQGQARTSGFAARFLIAWPASTQGTRIYRRSNGTGLGLTAYQKRIRQLLDMPLPTNKRGGLVPTALGMRPQAFEAWETFYNDVERELRGAGQLSDVKDVASKSAENCARIAALFHVFERGPGGQIEVNHVTAAARIAAWHLAESRRFLGGLSLPKPITNAMKLEPWLIAVCRDRGVVSLSVREIQNRGPNPVRLKAQLQAAITELVEANRLRRVDNGRAVELNPALLRR